MDELVKYLKALVFLQAQDYVEADGKPKVEVLLTKAGLKHAEVAEILGKTTAAVAKTVSRAK